VGVGGVGVGVGVGWVWIRARVGRGDRVGKRLRASQHHRTAESLAGQHDRVKVRLRLRLRVGVGVGVRVGVRVRVRVSAQPRAWQVSTILASGMRLAVATWTSTPCSVASAPAARPSPAVPRYAVQRTYSSVPPGQAALHLRCVRRRRPVPRTPFVRHGYSAVYVSTQALALAQPGQRILGVAEVVSAAYARGCPTLPLAYH